MTEVKKSYQVGDEILYHCTKCKADMPHVITAVGDDGTIKKVMCKGCNTTRVYKAKSHVQSEEATPEPAPAARPTNEPRKKLRRSRKKDWNALIADLQDDDLVDYDLSQDFTYITAIRHEQFGVGVISKIISDKQMEVIFKEGTKVLVQNYKMA